MIQISNNSIILMESFNTPTLHHEMDLKENINGDIIIIIDNNEKLEMDFDSVEKR